MANRLSPKERQEQLQNLKSQLKDLAIEIFKDKQNIYNFLGEDILTTRLDYARKAGWDKKQLIGALTVEICGAGNASIGQCYENIRNGQEIDINKIPDISPNIPQGALQKAYELKKFQNEIVVLSYQNLFYLFYFKGEELKLATLASPGDINHKTPHRAFKTDFKEEAYISQSFPGPMPRAIYLGEGGYFIHMGKTTGEPLSHGCIRIPGIYAKKLFEMIPSNAHIPVRIYRP